MNVWIPIRLAKKIVVETNRMFPKETGGVFMGYVLKRDLFITKVIGPGPKAIHSGEQFIPDYGFQENEIAKVYRESECRWTYIGDWHSHPKQAKGNLSPKDRATLKRIAKYKDARISTPLMMIIYGERDNWGFAAWQWQRRKPLQFRSAIIAADLQIFDDTLSASNEPRT